MLDPSAPIQDDAQRARKPLSPRMTLVIAALCAIAIMWLNEDTYHRTTQTLVQIQHGHATRSTINTVVRRLVEAESGHPIAVLADLQGPKLRVGTFANGPHDLDDGQSFRFDLDPTPGDATRVQLPHPEIFAALEPGDDFAFFGFFYLRCSFYGNEHYGRIVESD